MSPQVILKAVPPRLIILQNTFVRKNVVRLYCDKVQRFTADPFGLSKSSDRKKIVLLY